MIFLAMVCGACARTRVEIPWPDKQPLKSITEAAGWPEATVRLIEDETGRRTPVSVSGWYVRLDRLVAGLNFRIQRLGGAS